MFSLVAPPRFPLSPLVHNVTGEEKWSKVYLLYFLIIALWCKMCRKCLGFCHLKTLESVHMHCVLGKSLSRHFTHLDAKNSCVTKVTVKSRKTQKTCLFFFFTATFRHWCIIIPSSHSSIFFQKRGEKKMWKKTTFCRRADPPQYERAQIVPCGVKPVSFGPVWVSNCWHRCPLCSLSLSAAVGRQQREGGGGRSGGQPWRSVRRKEALAWDVSAWMLRICVQHTT